MTVCGDLLGPDPEPSPVHAKAQASWDSGGRTHLHSGSAFRDPLLSGLLKGTIRDLPPYGVLGGKNRGFFRKWFLFSILASSRLSRALCGTCRCFIHFLLFGVHAFFEAQESTVNNRQEDIRACCPVGQLCEPQTAGQGRSSLSPPPCTQCPNIAQF